MAYKGAVLTLLAFWNNNLTDLDISNIIKVFKITATGGGSSSGSPSHFLPPGHSPTPSSTPVSELSPGNYI